MFVPHLIVFENALFQSAQRFPRIPLGMNVLAKIVSMRMRFFMLALLLILAIFDRVVFFNPARICPTVSLLIEPLQRSLLVDPVQVVSFFRQRHLTLQLFRHLARWIRLRRSPESNSQYQV